MAKKYKRKEHIQARRAREEKEKQQNKKHLTKRQKIGIAAALVGAIAVVILFVIFLLPLIKGNVITLGGRPVFVSESDMLAYRDGSYHKVGTWTEPDSEVMERDPEYRIAFGEQQYKFERYYNMKEQTHGIKGVYVTTIGTSTLDDVYTRVSSFNNSVGELQEMSIGDTVVHYYSMNNPRDDEQALFNTMVSCYIEAPGDSLVLFSLMSEYVAQDEVPSGDDMIAGFEKLGLVDLIDLK